MKSVLHYAAIFLYFMHNHLPLVKHDFAEQRLDYQLIKLLNTNESTTFTLKDDTLHSLKKSVFCLKTSYFMNKYEPPGGNFASGAVWHTIAFKVSAFHFFWPKTE